MLSPRGKWVLRLPGSPPHESWPSGAATASVLPVAELRFAFFEGEARSSSDAAKVLNSYFRFLGRERERITIFL